MDTPNPNPNSNPASMRVLIRPPPSATATSYSSPSSQTIPIPSSSSDPPSTDGVVVVGFIGRSPDESAQLINRILDSNVFGSGNLDKTICVEKEQLRDWFKWRRISYYHEEQKGILFLQFCSTRCPAMDDGFSDSGSGFDTAFKEHDFGDLEGMLFMFSVTPPFPVILATCPVIQFEASCLPPSIPEREQKLQFSLGCQVVLPPESFLTLRLPFVYGVELEDGSLCPLKFFEHQPEVTAWITKGTTLQVISKRNSVGQD